MEDERFERFKISTIDLHRAENRMIQRVVWFCMTVPLQNVLPSPAWNISKFGELVGYQKWKIDQIVLNYWSVWSKCHQKAAVIFDLFLFVSLVATSSAEWSLGTPCDGFADRNRGTFGTCEKSSFRTRFEGGVAICNLHVDGQAGFGNSLDSVLFRAFVGVFIMSAPRETRVFLKTDQMVSECNKDPSQKVAILLFC
jgi:hypothetical protein